LVVTLQGSQALAYSASNVSKSHMNYETRTVARDMSAAVEEPCALAGIVAGAISIGIAITAFPVFRQTKMLHGCCILSP